MYIWLYLYTPDINVSYLKNITNCLNHVSQMNHNHRFVVAGDFNLPNINWNTDIPFSTNTLDLEIIEYIMDNGLFQLVNKPTRSNNILDLVFV